MEPNSYKGVERQLCPYYGFMWSGDSLEENGSDRCGLITGYYSPCQMKNQGKQPDGDQCPLRKSGLEKNLNLEKTQVFSREFPKGIPLADWMNYISKKSEDTLPLLYEY